MSHDLTDAIRANELENKRCIELDLVGEGTRGRIMYRQEGKSPVSTPRRMRAIPTKFQESHPLLEAIGATRQPAAFAHQTYACRVEMAPRK